HVNGAGLTLAQLLDQHDALLELRLPLLELLDLLNHGMQTRRLLLRGDDRGVDLRGLARDGPVPPADEENGENQDDAAANRHLLPGGAEHDRLLLRRFALRREEVDANHRSPVFRSARPTATAAIAL